MTSGPLPPYAPGTDCLVADDLPPYLVRWLDLDGAARDRLVFILDGYRPGDADRMLVREFGLSFAGVTLVRKVLGRHSGRSRGVVTPVKVDQVLTMWRKENSSEGQNARLLDGSQFVDSLGVLRTAPPSEVMNRIGAVVGLSRVTVRKILEEYSDDPPQRTRKMYRRIPEEVRREVVALLHTDMTQAEIAMKLNMTRRTVSRISRDEGLIRDPPAIGSTEAGRIRRRNALDRLDAQAKQMVRGPKNTERAQAMRRNGG